MNAVANIAPPCEHAIIEQFRAAMAEKGIVTSDSVEADGSIHRFHVEGDRKGSKNGWYILHIDERPAGAFGCCKRHGVGTKFSWSAKCPAKPLTRVERREYAEKMARQKAEREASEAARHAAAAIRAQAIWDAAEPATDDHPYLLRKGVGAHGLRVGKWEVTNPETGEIHIISNSALLVPICDRSRNLHNLQAIFPKKIMGGGTRDKDFLKHGAKLGYFYAIGKPQELDGRKVFIVCEGFATGASIHEASGHCVLTAFDISNLAPVAASIRERQPDAIILFAADNDRWVTEPINNPGVHHARKAAQTVNGLVAIPQFANIEGKPTDFNDLFMRQGLNAVAAQINAALAASTVSADLEDAISSEDVPADAATNSPHATQQEAEFEPEEDQPASKLRVLAPRLVAEQRMAEIGVSAVPAATPKRRTVQVVPGELPAAVDQAEAALYEQCPDIFQRGNTIVRPVRALVEVANGDHAEGIRLSRVNKHHLAERLTAAANWEKYDGRAGDFVPADCPMNVAETYLARDGSWRLRRLSAVIEAPTLRPDGSVLAGEGYDAATGLLVVGDQSKFPTVPDSPTHEDARDALDRLKALISNFPFVGGDRVADANSNRSVALSAILTACIRRSLPTAPMHCFSAPTAGSGKSTLVDVASIIATGRRAPVMSQGRNEEEQEKRLASALLAGDAVVSIDNATQPIDGDLLCQTLTQPAVRLRVLGASELRTMPTSAFFCATGNALLIRGDMTRRALLCSLDPQCERPELRVFTCNPMQLAHERRAEYLCDALTILRAFHVAGRPAPAGINPLGSFEAWSAWVRNSLIWLGEEDPVRTMEEARKGDPKLEAIMALMAQWDAVIGRRDATVREVINIATEQDSGYTSARASFRHEDFREALLTVAGQGGVINSRSLGKWLAAHKERIVGLPSEASGDRQYRRFEQGALKHKVATWRLTSPPVAK